MFGFGKTPVTIHDLAQRLSQIALSPITNPTEQDIGLQGKAVSLGMSKIGFSLEAASLHTYTLVASINRRVLDRGISNDQGRALLDEYVVACEHVFLNELPGLTQIELFASTGLLPQAAFELVLDRLEEYARPEHVIAPHKSIPYLFATFCGVPDPNEVLMRIGWGIFIGRGMEYVDQLKKFKLL